MSEPRTRKPRVAGIDLQDTESNRAVIAGIMEDNPDSQIDHMPGLVRIRNENGLHITKATVEKHVGDEWDTEDIQLSIVSLAGNLDIDEEHIDIKWKH